MQIVINIPEEIVKAIQNGKDYRYDIHTVIAQGTPLPKGHGRLIDADKLDRIMYHKAFETDSDMQKWDSGCWIRYKMFENAMDDAPIISTKEIKYYDEDDSVWKIGRVIVDE